MEFVGIQSQYKSYKQEIDQAIHTVLDEGNFIMGKQVYRLEEVLASYVGVKHCITVSSGTDSLQIALMALGIGPGDEVITVPFTWISTAEAIAIIGAKPVFVDIDPETYLIDLVKMEEAITSKTKAILPVSLFGQMPDYTALNAIADKYGLPVLEDAAQSFGALQKGQLSCGMTTIGSTSFFPTKPLGCYGDGGALFTNDDQLAAKMRAIRTHGGEQRDHHLYLGLNGRLDTLQAAILEVKFAHLPKELQIRQFLGFRYSTLLKDSCITPKIIPGHTHVYAQYTIRVPERDALMERLKIKGIPTRIYYPKCIHEQPAFAYLGYGENSLPEAEKACREVLSLPMHPCLTFEEQDQVIQAIKESISELRVKL